jgi:hypothetical protein
MKRPYLWIRIGTWNIGITPDTGGRPYFSERYGYVKVARFLGYKWSWQRRAKNVHDQTPMFFGGWV